MLEAQCTSWGGIISATVYWPRFVSNASEHSAALQQAALDAAKQQLAALHTQMDARGAFPWNPCASAPLALSDNLMPPQGHKMPASVMCQMQRRTYGHIIVQISLLQPGSVNAQAPAVSTWSWYLSTSSQSCCGRTPTMRCAITP
jgi:hypothetical protein